jgi:hypothetical protein
MRGARFGFQPCIEVISKNVERLVSSRTRVITTKAMAGSHTPSMLLSANAVGLPVSVEASFTHFPLSSNYGIVNAVAEAGAVASTRTAASGSRTPLHQQEIAQQVREREQELANLQHKHSVHCPSPSASASSESVPLHQSVVCLIEELKREVEELKACQMMWEMNERPPSEYS